MDQVLVTSCDSLRLIFGLLHFYRAMHYSAKYGPRDVVCPSVCDDDGSGPHRLKIVKTNCANN